MLNEVVADSVSTEPTNNGLELQTSRSSGISLFKADFEELYQRHLCRHAEFGLNVLHLISVYGVYLSIFCLAAMVVNSIAPQSSFAARTGLLFAMAIPYLIAIAVNVPPLIVAAITATMLAFSIVSMSVPVLPWWLHLMSIVFWHRSQVWSHRMYTLQRDMSRFDARYPKGKALFIVLAIYELPILYRYLLTGRRDWV